MTSWRRPWLGALFVLPVAASFSLNAIFTVFAYRGGSDPLSVLMVRIVFACALVALVLRLVGVPFRLEPRARLTALALGLPMGTYSFLVMASFERMPVALAILTFYTYPLLTAIAAWLMGQERPTLLAVAAMVAAFVGLAFALDVGGSAVDLVGVAMALGGAVLFTGILLVSGRVLKNAESRAVTFHMLLATMVVLAIPVAIAGDIAWPHTTQGWIGFAAVPFFFSFAITGFFFVVAITGPVTASFVMNIEPVLSMVFGAVLLGQQLAGHQVAGGLVVVAAIIAVRWQAMRSARLAVPASSRADADTL